MERTITTLTDAKQIINEWTESYTEQPTASQIEQAAALLVDHVGGFGHELTRELSDSFDLDSALDDADTELSAYLTALHSKLKSEREAMRKMNGVEMNEYALNIAHELRSEMVADQFDTAMLAEDFSDLLKDEFFWK